MADQDEEALDFPALQHVPAMESAEDVSCLGARDMIRYRSFSSSHVEIDRFDDRDDRHFCVHKRRRTEQHSAAAAMVAGHQLVAFFDESNRSYLLPRPVPVKVRTAGELADAKHRQYLWLCRSTRAPADIAHRLACDRRVGVFPSLAAVNAAVRSLFSVGNANSVLDFVDELFITHPQSLDDSGGLESEARSGSSDGTVIAQALFAAMGTSVLHPSTIRLVLDNLCAYGLYVRAAYLALHCSVLANSDAGLLPVGVESLQRVLDGLEETEDGSTASASRTAQQPDHAVSQRARTMIADELLESCGTRNPSLMKALGERRVLRHIQSCFEVGLVARGAALLTAHMVGDCQQPQSGVARPVTDAFVSAVMSHALRDFLDGGEHHEDDATRLQWAMNVLRASLTRRVPLNLVSLRSAISCAIRVKQFASAFVFLMHVIAQSKWDCSPLGVAPQTNEDCVAFVECVVLVLEAGTAEDRGSVSVQSMLSVLGKASDASSPDASHLWVRLLCEGVAPLLPKLLAAPDERAPRDILGRLVSAAARLACVTDSRRLHLASLLCAATAIGSDPLHYQSRQPLLGQAWPRIVVDLFTLPPVSNTEAVLWSAKLDVTVVSTMLGGGSFGSSDSRSLSDVAVQIPCASFRSCVARILRAQVATQDTYVMILDAAAIRAVAATPQRRTAITAMLGKYDATSGGRMLVPFSSAASLCSAADDQSARDWLIAHSKSRWLCILPFSLYANSTSLSSDTEDCQELMRSVKMELLHAKALLVTGSQGARDTATSLDLKPAVFVDDLLKKLSVL